MRSARSRNRAAAWQHDLAQWRQYQIARAPDREAATNAEYEHQLAGGPDFTAYHVGSSFAEPPLHQITREDRVRALQAFDAVRAGLYRHCRAPRAQAVSQNYRHVYGVLLSYAVKRGRVYPCLETIAMAAMVLALDSAARDRVAQAVRLPRPHPSPEAGADTPRQRPRLPDEQRLPPHHNPDGA